MSEESKSKLIWQADSTHPELTAHIREALRQVVDPEIGLNIIELGLVRDLTIEEDHVHMKMILTTPFCPYGPALLDMARQKVENVVGKSVTIELGMEMWDFSMMEEGVGADWGFY